jgi:signal transduction histidine kinase
MTYTDPENEWLNMVAHDLKTPINAVRGCLELVQQLGPLNERQKHFADRAFAGLQRMEHLVSRLLDISWIDADMQLDLAACDLRALINETVDMLQETAKSRQIEVYLSFDSKIDTVVADAQRLGQVLDNLISNAIKYNRDAGQVWIKATHEPDFILVSVRDTGIGISPEDQLHVFDRFFRSRQGVALKIEGSGLGLAITRSIVQKHLGRIWLESKVDEGTTFYFTLPLNAEGSDSNEGAGEFSQTSGEGAERREPLRRELASEESDVVNDDIQETREYTQVDSSSDDL